MWAPSNSTESKSRLRHADCFGRVSCEERANAEKVTRGGWHIVRGESKCTKLATRIKNSPFYFTGTFDVEVAPNAFQPEVTGIRTNSVYEMLCVISDAGSCAGIPYNFVLAFN